MTSLMVLLLVSTIPPTAVSSCQMTIPELTTLMRPEPVELLHQVELIRPPLTETASKAELIIEGQVRVLKTYLSDDQCDLYTDYELVGPLLVAGVIPPPKTPGAPEPIIWRQRGGTMMVDGVKVIVGDTSYPALSSGQRVIVFLSRAAEKGRFEITNGVYGAFSVQPDGRVRAKFEPTEGDEDLKSLPKGAFVERVTQARMKQ